MSNTADTKQNDKQLQEDIALLDKLLGVEARKPGKAAALPAAIRIIETLEPAGGKQVPVFPASYAGATDQSPPVYDLVGVVYGEVEETVRVKKSSTKVRQILSAKLCAIDSPQSQANRMEPAFVECEDLASLVPQAKATIPRRSGEDGSTSVLLLPHRVADFRVRLSNSGPTVRETVTAFANGNALPLLRTFPTSVLFGFWDSRDQGTKHARILLSRIDATNVVPCRRHALYSGPYSNDEFGEAILEREADRDRLSELGFSAAPSEGLGGVMLDPASGKIERLALLSLTDLARIHCQALSGQPADSENDDTKLTNAARRYLFSLAALAEGHERSKGSHRLRSGCELIGVEEPTFELLTSKTRRPQSAPSDEDAIDPKQIESLYFDRARLIKLAESAMSILGIKAGDHPDYAVSKDSLREAFGTTAPPAAKKTTSKKAAKKAANTGEPSASV